MVLSSIMPELFMYGFMGGVMTRNYAFPTLILVIVWIMQTIFFKHRADPPPLDIHVHVTIPGMTILGSIVSHVFVVFAGTPRFVNSEPWDSRGRPNSWLYAVSLFVAAISLGVYFLEEDNVPVGASLVAVFGILTVAMFGVYFAGRGIIEDGIAQGKYLILFSVLVTAAAAYDYPLTQTENQSIRPWQTVIFSAALIFVYIIFGIFTLLEVFVTDTEQRWYAQSSAADRTPMGRRWIVFLLMFGVHVIVYVPAMIADEIGAQEFGVPAPVLDEEKKIYYVLWAILASTATLFIIMAGWAIARGWRGLELSTDAPRSKAPVRRAYAAMPLGNGRGASYRTALRSTGL